MRVFKLRVRSGFLAVLFAASMLLLTACENAEDRAEKHFLSAIELLEKGDEERAIVEFRNVFKLNVRHKEARSVYAALQPVNRIQDCAIILFPLCMMLRKNLFFLMPSTQHRVIMPFRMKKSLP
ncbi:hypothetical protein [Methylophaga sp.]|uniref:hypothetical protein n=1 Tax=Methylophaga sp. TaxID=2024840 RepID=UPI0025E5905C|nr:hypothetical protein [Methylophaga sp.]